MKRTDRIKKLASAIQAEIVSCPNEQSRDEGETIWINGSSTPLQDLLSEYDVPEELEDEVVDRLRCPECDSPLEKWQDVGTRYEHERAHDSTVDSALEKHGKKLFAFWDFLVKNPMLGATHSFGKRLLKELKTTPQIRLENLTWYRARVDKEHGFGPTPALYVSDQRYNSSGQPRWYFSDNAETAVAETSPMGTAWVQQFNVGQLDGLLDLRAWHAEDDRVMRDEGEYNSPHNPLVVALIFGDLLTQRYFLDDEDLTDSEKRRFKPEYLVSRFVAEAAAVAGFKGILCRSVRLPGNNLIVFAPDWSPAMVGEAVQVSLSQETLQKQRSYILSQGLGFDIGQSFPEIPPVS